MSNPDMEVSLFPRVTIALIAAAAVFAGCAGLSQSGGDRGRLVYDTCIPCHGKDGSGNMALRAPSIAGLPDWYVTTQLKNFKADIRGASPDDNEGHRMRPMARTLHRPGDLEAVAHYVSSLPPVWAKPMYAHGDRAAGEQQYTSICITCHGPEGRGNKDMGSPPLVAQADWYMVAQLQKFQSGMRGTHPDDVFGAQMRAMSMTLTDTTAMHDVVAYIKTLPH